MYFPTEHSHDRNHIIQTGSEAIFGLSISFHTEKVANFAPDLSSDSTPAQFTIHYVYASECRLQFRQYTQLISQVTQATFHLIGQL